ncbi:hypothetical protein D3C86_1283190 [compost metagenome]
MESIAFLSQGLEPTPLAREISAADSRIFGLSGFHEREYWGAWSAQSRYAVRLRPERPFSRITLKGHPYLTPHRPSCTLNVAVNGVEVGARLLTEGVQSLSFDFPLVTDETVWIDIRSDDGASPNALGSSDVRMLGFGLSSVQID